MGYTNSNEDSMSSNKTAEKKRVRGAFDTFTREGFVDVKHLESDTTVISYSEANAHLAEETCDWANKIKRTSKSRLREELASATGKKAEVMPLCIELLKIDLNAVEPTTLKPKMKTKESYSGARAMVDGAYLTDKEKAILGSIENGNTFAEDIAADLGIHRNAVSGHVSVLVSKGTITTVRTKKGADTKRTISIVDTEWRDKGKKPRNLRPVVYKDFQEPAATPAQ